MKFMLFLVLFHSIAFASAKTLNCLGNLQDGFEVNICKNVVDLKKLRSFDCTKELEDGYQFNLCSNAINPSTGGELNCSIVADSREFYNEYKLCKKVPDPKSVKKINCLGELEDGYQVNVCRKVDLKKQQDLVKRLTNF